ncbi:hypothetical protein INS49_007653 [Diaporthe citri]|uniref:uncharacterized protein n=1 Tax=Diaporthe citri TaxID=83186 RepID=UPI001C8183FC|nr:uncharacterized protein INS49_007653 [Diaporthe citri]KAG6362561.1 hypothetical protein INS49_007653 [Diaporthe citri]
MASSHTREALLAPISQTLASKDIPAVLWGNFLLTVHGVPSIVSEADFVVHDSLLPAAIAALMHSQELKLTPCPDPASCYISKADRPSPVPAFHAHRPDSNVHVALHVQSATLGDVVLPLKLDQGADLLSLGLIPASHPSLPPPDELGFGHGSLLPQDDGSPSQVWFVATVIYFMEYVAPQGHLEVDKLSPACGTFWKEINDEDIRSSDAIKHLREGRT